MIRFVPILRAALSCAIPLLAIQVADAGIIVGTVDGNDNSIADVNAVILAYNGTHEPDLLLTDNQVGKLEGNTITGSAGLSLSDFTFYALSDDFDTDNTLEISSVFSAGNLVAIPDASVNIADDGLNIVAFTYDGVGSAPFSYYVSKNDGKFTVWTLMAGFNPVYVELSPGDTKFEPIKNAISHISFYDPTGPTINEMVPEPSSVILLGMGGLSLLGYGWRRRKIDMAA